jgi:hypothetical protein
VKGAPITALAQRLTATTNPAEVNTTLMDHIFGGGKNEEQPAAYTPVQFGPAEGAK